jgi:hypothetical protein
MKTIKNITLSLLLLVSGVTAAQTLTYSFGDPITTSLVPYGTDPWFTIQLEQMENYTKITMNSHLSIGEFIDQVGFNLNTNVDYQSLIFTPINSIGEFTVPQISNGNDTFNVGGGNKYDVNIQFATINASGGMRRFNLDDTFTFSANIPITSFTNNTDQLPSIVHIQGIGPNSDQSAWLSPTIPTIPEPSSILLGSIGMVLLLNRKRYV